MGLILSFSLKRQYDCVLYDSFLQVCKKRRKQRKWVTLWRQECDMLASAQKTQTRDHGAISYTYTTGSSALPDINAQARGPQWYKWLWEFTSAVLVCNFYSLPIADEELHLFTRVPSAGHIHQSREITWCDLAKSIKPTAHRGPRARAYISGKARVPVV